MRRLQHRLEPVLQPRMAAGEVREVDEPAGEAEEPEHRQRARHDPRRLVQRRLLRLARPVLAHERHRHEPAHVDRRQQRRERRQAPEEVEHGLPRAPAEHRRQDLVLREEAGEHRDAGDGQRRDPHQRRGPRHPAAEPAHVPHVLRVGMAVGRVIGVVHGVDHAARTEEEHRLEEGVRHQVEDAGDVGAASHREEHEAELRDGREGQHLLDVVLPEADRAGEERRRGADRRHHEARGRGVREDPVAPHHQVDAGRHHRRRMDQRRHRRRARHGVRQPGVERDLRRLAGTPERDEQRDRRDQRPVRHQLGRLLRDLREVHRPQPVPGQEHRHEEAEVADPVHDERLLAGVRIRLDAVPEADQQVGAESHPFPADEHHRHGAAQHQHQHEHDEEVEVREVARVAVVRLHVADAEQVDEAAHAGDHQRHERRQVIQPERDVDLEVARLDPLPEMDRQLVRRAGRLQLEEAGHRHREGRQHRARARPATPAPSRTGARRRSRR